MTTLINCMHNLEKIRILATDGLRHQLGHAGVGASAHPLQGTGRSRASTGVPLGNVQAIGVGVCFDVVLQVVDDIRQIEEINAVLIVTIHSDGKAVNHCLVLLSCVCCVSQHLRLYSICKHLSALFDGKNKKIFLKNFSKTY